LVELGGIFGELELDGLLLEPFFFFALSLSVLLGLDAVAEAPKPSSEALLALDGSAGVVEDGEVADRGVVDGDEGEAPGSGELVPGLLGVPGADEPGAAPGSWASAAPARARLPPRATLRTRLCMRMGGFLLLQRVQAGKLTTRGK
jgi:hypothetical protein